MNMKYPFRYKCVCVVAWLMYNQGSVIPTKDVARGLLWKLFFFLFSFSLFLIEYKITRIFRVMLSFYYETLIRGLNYFSFQETLLKCLVVLVIFLNTLYSVNSLQVQIKLTGSLLNWDTCRNKIGFIYIPTYTSIYGSRLLLSYLLFYSILSWLSTKYFRVCGSSNSSRFKNIWVAYLWLKKLKLSIILSACLADVNCVKQLLYPILYFSLN